MQMINIKSSVNGLTMTVPDDRTTRENLVQNSQGLMTPMKDGEAISHAQRSAAERSGKPVVADVVAPARTRGPGRKQKPASTASADEPESPAADSDKGEAVPSMPGRNRRPIAVAP